MRDDLAVEQARIAERFGVELDVPAPDAKVGVARNVRDRLVPLTGLRHPPEGGTCGWYPWAGEELHPSRDFFVPLHVTHLADWCPQALPYLGLPPGWRFLLAPGHEDVWFDEGLL